MKRLFTLLALCMGLYAHAADPYYNVMKPTTGTYTELTNPTVIATTFDQESWSIDLGTNFKLFGLDYPANGTNFMIGRFGAIVAQMPDQDKMAIFDFFAIKDFIARDATSSVSYTFEGDMGSRELAIQYKNVGFKDGASTDYMNLQVRLAEDGSYMSVIIGPHSIADISKVVNISSDLGPSIGITHGTKTLSEQYEVWFLTGNPASPSASSMFSASMNGVPANGQIYTWKHDLVSNPPKLSLTSPIGTEKWKGGEVHNITWHATNVAKIKIEYTFEGFNKYKVVAENVDATTGSYVWTVPNTPSNQCMVKISDMSDPNRYEESGTFFTITPGTNSIAEDGVKAGLSLYPNPGQGRFSLAVPFGTEISSTSLTNLTGKTILPVTLMKAGDEYRFDVSGIKPGMYLLNVATRNETYTLKLNIR